MKNLFNTLFFWSLTCSVSAQDFQFVQAFQAPQLLNPAATGHISGRSLRVAALYRGQWDNAWSDKAYQGSAVAVDWRHCLGKNFYALGLSVQHDWSPLGALSNTSALLSGAFHVHLGDETFGAVGVSLGGLSYRLDAGGLRFDAQYQNGFYNSALANGETFAGNGRIRPDMGSGVEFFNNRAGWAVGAAWHHINKPVYSLLADENRLGIGFNLHGSYTLSLNNSGSRACLLRGVWRRQSFTGNDSKQWQALLGGAYRLGWAGNADAYLSGGALVRLNGQAGRAVVLNAIIPTVEWNSEDWTVGLSYDANVSPILTRFAGGLELSLSINLGKTDRCIVCRGPG